MKIYTLNDIQLLPKVEQYFAFSKAYLNAAEVLCCEICQELTDKTYADGAVVMSLTFHAEELFLKAAITQKKSTFNYGQKGHDLVFLNTKFTEYYPDSKFRFSLIFNRQPPTAQELSDLYKMDIDKAHEHIRYIEKQSADLPEDQLHRYPFGRNENEWRALLGFEPCSFLVNIKELKRDLKKIKALILSND